MKRNHLKLLIVLGIMFLACLINIFVSGITLFTESNLTYIIFLCLILGILIFLMGFDKNRSIFQLDAFQIVFIYCIIYLIAIYIFGFFFGFIKSPYSYSKILQNTLPVIIVIVLQELIRFQFSSKGKEKNLVLILMTIVFIAYDISIPIKYFEYLGATSLYELIGTVIIASITRNVLLTYISVKIGYKVTIMYRLLFGILIYIVPFTPNLGLYLQSLLDVIFPIIIFLKLNTFLAKYKPIPRSARKLKLKRFLLMTPTFAFVIIVFVLISGLFKIYAMAVASNSMQDTFSRGDMIIIEKLNKNEKDALKVGDIIVYTYGEKVITHRIYEIEEGKSRLFITKGDNNDDIDSWKVNYDIIQGKINYKIPYVGYPSVWLYELIK